jgi:hypothetical protein
MVRLLVLLMCKLPYLAVPAIVTAIAKGCT